MPQNPGESFVNSNKENKDGGNKDGGASGINKDKLKNVIKPSSGIGTRSRDSSRDKGSKKSPNKEEQ